jgi:hypothetical protein
MLKGINLQLFAEPNAVTEKTGDDQVSDQGSQAEVVTTEATTETTKETTEQTDTTATETDVSTETKAEGEQTDTAKQTKEENSFFKSMRIKAEKEAEAKYKKQLEDEVAKKVNEQVTEFKNKLAPVLPDGYEDVDEYLKSLDEDTTTEELETAEEVVTEEVKKDNPTLDETQIEEIVAKKLEAIPEFKAMQEQKAKDTEDKFIIDSFEEVKSKFADVKTADDVPLDVWEMWQLGKNGRTLISCMKEYRYENDIEKAKVKGAAAIKSQINSVAHTGAVGGGSNTAVHIEEETQVPPETQTMLAKAGIPKDKWAEYYKKYHR